MKNMKFGSLLGLIKVSTWKLKSSLYKEDINFNSIAKFVLSMMPQ